MSLIIRKQCFCCGDPLIKTHTTEFLFKLGDSTRLENLFSCIKCRKMINTTWCVKFEAYSKPIQVLQYTEYGEGVVYAPNSNQLAAAEVRSIMYHIHDRSSARYIPAKKGKVPVLTILHLLNSSNIR